MFSIIIGGITTPGKSFTHTHTHTCSSVSKLCNLLEKRFYAAGKVTVGQVPSNNNNNNNNNNNASISLVQNKLSSRQFKQVCLSLPATVQRNGSRANVSWQTVPSHKRTSDCKVACADYSSTVTAAYSLVAYGLDCLETGVRDQLGHIALLRGDRSRSS